jgi:hypothetical protein
MLHVQVGKRSSLFLIGAVVFLLSFYGATISRASVDNSPTLKSGKVTPEIGPWGSIFIFDVVYTDPENLMPAEGYPKVYIGGGIQGRTMVENDPMDDDVTDGKLYRYEWTPVGENDKKLPHFENFRVSNRYPVPGEQVVFSGYLFDNINFYFYSENPRGENARDPMTGAHSGPSVALGERTVVLKLLLEDNNPVMGSDNTDENGYFSISIEAPSSGSFGYITEFSGDEYHESSSSHIECLITFDAFTISIISGALSVILISVLIFLVSRGISKVQYLRPVLIGLLIAMVFLFLFMAGAIGLIIAGAVTGYMYAREVRGWSKHLRVGGLVALFLLLFLCLARAHYIRETAEYYVLTFVGRSIGNSELLKLLILETLFSALFYIVYIGLGAILGGLLRKALKPAEQKPTTVAGSATTAASG